MNGIPFYRRQSIRMARSAAATPMIVNPETMAYGASAVMKSAIPFSHPFWVRWGAKPSRHSRNNRRFPVETKAADIAAVDHELSDAHFSRLYNMIMRITPRAATPSIRETPAYSGATSTWYIGIRSTKQIAEADQPQHTNRNDDVDEQRPLTFGIRALVSFPSGHTNSFAGNETSKPFTKAFVPEGSPNELTLEKLCFGRRRGGCAFRVRLRLKRRRNSELCPRRWNHRAEIGCWNGNSEKRGAA